MIEKYYYLAAPYSVGDKASQEDMEMRFWQITAMAAELMKADINIYSPITHGHFFSDLGLKRNFEWWLEKDMAFLSDASGLFVLKLEGWQMSPGVKAEIKFAKDMEIPIFYLAPDARVLNKGLEVGGITRGEVIEFKPEPT